MITKLDDWALSSNPHISPIAIERYGPFMDMLQACSETGGAPHLDEIHLAQKTVQETERHTQSQQLLDCRKELRSKLGDMAQPLVEARIAALGLPSLHDGAEIGAESDESISWDEWEDKEPTPWEMELKSIGEAMTALDLPLGPLEHALQNLLERAKSSLESRSRTSDVMTLTGWLHDVHMARA